MAMWNTTIGTDIGGAVVNMNASVNSLIGATILIGIFAVVLILEKGKSTPTAMMHASMVAFIASLFLNAMTLIPVEWALIPPILLAGSMIMAHVSKSEAYV